MTEKDGRKEAKPPPKPKSDEELLAIFRAIAGKRPKEKNEEKEDEK